MTGHDDEFEEFLARKRPVFRRPGDDEVEPPDNVDRLVLRQARDAIKASPPERVYRGPGWGVPLAVAATLLVCLSLVLHVVMPKKGSAPAAATQQVAQQVDAAPAADATSNNPPPPPPPMTASRSEPAGAAARTATAASAPAEAVAPAAAPPVATERVAGATDAPWRGNAQSWLAEIERLRAEGKTAEADAEVALYKRQHRAYAGTPDR